MRAMIDGRTYDMIDTRWFDCAPIKPGHLPDPEEHDRRLRKPEPQELVDICLSCPMPECRMDSSACPLRGR